MTFEEIDRMLPNGLHDAEVSSIAVDYVLGTVTIQANLWIGDMGTPNREDHRTGSLIATGLHFCAVEPPDSVSPFARQGSPITVSGDLARSDTLPALEKLAPGFPPGVFCFRLFVHEWNSFIHVAAKDIIFTWT